MRQADQRRALARRGSFVARYSSVAVVAVPLSLLTWMRPRNGHRGARSHAVASRSERSNGANGVGSYGFRVSVAASSATAPALLLDWCSFADVAAARLHLWPVAGAPPFSRQRPARGRSRAARVPVPPAADREVSDETVAGCVLTKAGFNRRYVTSTWRVCHSDDSSPNR
jgi:hypothetical protein